ncbi:MAG: tetratricopeptide repeat protein [Pseudobdellovibrionaceae bacterium]
MMALSTLFLSWSGLMKVPSLPHVKSLILNRQGNQQLKAQNYSSAFETYVKTLEFDPFAAEIHLDLGLTYEGQQQPEKAMPSYENALKYAQSNEMKFISLFNQAQLLGKDKKIDEALELYQKALAFDPTSKEVKTNIELLIQMQQQQQKNDQEDKKNQDSKDKKDQKENKDNKDGKDNKDSKGNKDSKENKDQGQGDKDKKEEKDAQGKDKKDPEDKKDKNEKSQYSQNQKYQPRPFKGQELSEGDVKKILGEIKQQEQKIRAEYNRKEVKEQPRDKDW